MNIALSLTAILLCLSSTVHGKPNSAAQLRSANCGQTSFIVDRGSSYRYRKTLTSPGYNNPRRYEANTDCAWEIDQNASNKRLKIKFYQLKIAADSNCDNDYVSVYDKDTGDLMLRLCGTRCKYSYVTLPEGHSAIVTFHSNLDNIRNRGFLLKYWNTVSLSSPTARCTCRVGGAQYCIDECGGISRAESGHVTSPFFPQQYATDLDCTWNIDIPDAVWITLRFTMIDIEEDGSECSYDNVKLYSYSDNETPIATLCGSICLPMIHVFDSRVSIHFHSDYSVNGDGYRLSYESSQDAASSDFENDESHILHCNCAENEGCEGDDAIYTDDEPSTTPAPTGCNSASSGQDIYSPNWPNRYGNNQYCIDRVEVEEGMYIRFTFLEFDMEEHGTCEYDSLRIHHGDLNSAVNIQSLCGDHTGSVDIANNIATLEFSSDSSVRGNGYHIRFEAISPSDSNGGDGNDGDSDDDVDRCGELSLTALNTAGTITSPNHPSNYPNNMDCSWRITAPEGKIIRLNVSSFQMEDHSSCSYDKLTIGEEYYCGDDIPPVIYSASNELTVEFHTDVSQTYEGFSLTYQAINADEVDIPETENEDVPCGIVPADLGILANIVGGVDATDDFYPWQVVLNRHGSFICGASIIHESWILTAAHCVIGYSARAFTIEAGANDRTGFSNSRQTRQVERVISHRLYDDNSLENDIALLKLSTHLTWSRGVRPVCVPTTSAPPETDCVITGWGATQSIPSSPSIMQVAQVPILPNAVCRPNLVAQGSDIKDNMMCAGNMLGGVDTCQGDSGGPLACRSSNSTTDNGAYYLQGVTSWGLGCAQEGLPGIYTRVANYADWIKTKTSMAVTGTVFTTKNDRDR